MLQRSKSQSFLLSRERKMFTKIRRRNQSNSRMPPAIINSSNLSLAWSPPPKQQTSKIIDMGQGENGDTGGTEEKSGWQCCNLLREYNQESTLHGPKYITRRGTHPVERICWTLVVAFSIVLGIYLTSNVVLIWQTNPITMSIEDTHYPLTNIDFPAITICPVNKVIVGKLVSELCRLGVPGKVAKTDNLTVILEKALPPYFGIFEKASTLDYDKLENSLGLNSTVIISLLRKASPICKDYLSKCRWNGEEIPCTSLFRVKGTDNGFCCSFNSVPTKFNLAAVGSANENSEIIGDYDGEDLGSDYDYVHAIANLCPSTPLNTNAWEPVCKELKFNGETADTAVKKTELEIRKASGSGSDRGLVVVINPLPCAWMATRSFHGSRVYVHDPKAFPEVNTKGMAVGPDSENFLSVKATLVETAHRTRTYPNQTRKCNFQDERILKYYKAYSRTNCLLEQHVDIYQSMCHCRPFYLPGQAPACNATGMKCVTSIAVNNVIHGSGVDNCPPACEQLTYEGSLSSVPLSVTNFGESVLRVFFKHSSVIKYKRDQLYSIEDIVGNIGGTLGLCTGFSLVTLIEIIYFFSCRWLFRRSKVAMEQQQT